MYRTWVAEAIAALLCEQLNVQPEAVVDDASIMDDLNADSLDVVEVIMQIEDAFGIKIPEDEAEQIATVGQAIDYVLAHADLEAIANQAAPAV